MRAAVILGGCTAAALMFAAPAAGAATLLVEGFLEGDFLPGPEDGDTMDYYRFEVIATGTVRIEVVDGFGGPLFQLAQFIGVEDEFGFLGNPYRIEPPGVIGRPQFLERILSPGDYVIVTGSGGRTSYDVFDGYVAVNPEGGGFGQAPYAYTITGGVRGVEYWDGHLDGTFTVARIPEPATPVLLLTGGAWLIWQRNGNERGANKKALHPTPRSRLVKMLSVIRTWFGFVGARSRS